MGQGFLGEGIGLEKLKNNLLREKGKREILERRGELSNFREAETKGGQRFETTQGEEGRK